MNDKVKELELIKEKLTSEYNALKNPKFTEIHNLENELTTKLNDINAQIDAIKASEKTKADIKLKVENGTFTSADYNVLSAEDKVIAVDAIFEYYASLVNSYHSLTALEFGVVIMTKLFAKSIDRAKLTAEEQAFLDAYVGVIGLHPLGVTDTNAWELAHVQRMMVESVQRRVEYLTAKMTITGAI